MLRLSWKVELLLLLSLLRRNVLGGIVKDQLDDCKSLVDQGRCRTDPELMKKYCEASCVKWAQEFTKVEVESVGEDEASFHDLSAKRATGEMIEFSQFDGYVTVVVNAAILCDEKKFEQGLEFFEGIHSIWPYIVEIVVFPFRHPDAKYDGKDCSKDEAAMRKQGRKIYVMEPVQINGPDTHPVYKYLKDKFKLDEMETDIATYFLVTPDGDQIEAHHGATANHMKNYIRQHLERDL